MSLKDAEVVMGRFLTSEDGVRSGYKLVHTSDGVIHYFPEHYTEEMVIRQVKRLGYSARRI